MKELEILVNMSRLVQKFLLKQTDIDKTLKDNSMEGIIRYAFTCKDKDIQAGYLVSSYFKDLYLYLTQNKLPSTELAIRKKEALAENTYY